MSAVIDPLAVESSSDTGASSLPPAVQDYRAFYASHFRKPGYNGKRHVTTVLVLLALTITGICVWAPPRLDLQGLYTVLATLLIANLVEYWMHRVFMHHPWPGLRALFERHTRRHHRYFNDQAMNTYSSREWDVVLFPPVLLLAFGTIALGLGLVVRLLFGPSAGSWFAIVCLLYYLSYEVLHFIYHLPPGARANRLPVLKFLTEHHRRHHQPQDMSHGNFNLVMPLCDWLFGTRLPARD